MFALFNRTPSTQFHHVHFFDMHGVKDIIIFRNNEITPIDSLGCCLFNIGIRLKLKVLVICEFYIDRIFFHVFSPLSCYMTFLFNVRGNFPHFPSFRCPIPFVISVLKLCMQKYVFETSSIR